MPTPTREHARAERLRQHAAEIERTRRVIGAMGMLVRGREARGRDGGAPLEVAFAGVEVDGRSLPAAVWVALRHDDVDAAIDAMTAVSATEFLIEEQEVMGEGYRLQSVRDTLPLPECELLTAQLSRALDVPLDVLTVIAEWGPDDPRAVSEVDSLLTSRFGAADRGDGSAAVMCAPPQTDAAADPHAEPSGLLTMTVDDAAQVLRLDTDQRRALTILVSNAVVTLKP